MKEDIKFDKISSYFTKIMGMFAIYLESRDGNGFERERYYIPEISQMTFSAKVPAEIRVKYDTLKKKIIPYFRQFPRKLFYLNLAFCTVTFGHST